jgi:hypothetical protein
LAWHVVGDVQVFWTHWRPSAHVLPTGSPNAMQSASVVQHAAGFRFVHETTEQTTATTTTHQERALMHSR